ncbi:MAG: tRNA (adenosine(37)-N6)-threonylcarbamoyltransferase complex dimerization subunit type 1 TsaB [Clostridiales bacterium]|jgi:tRNA threonylcarbamoyladenosine biosynthesis protein TsaB|nr:tRNA (adenosine(37)-N6)-threonylcarbamoyltransferase complex dimerization subunit type 1 TsaB [Clostridiales bacterium]
MMILALDASGRTVSAAILQDGRVAASQMTGSSGGHSVTLMPMIQNMLSLTGLTARDADYIAVTTGPGSFTGLKIAAGAAKGLAHAAGAPILRVPTLDALAYNIFNENAVIIPILDARRGQVYAGFYKREGEGLTALCENAALSFEGCLEKAAAYPEPKIFLGDAAELYAERIRAAGAVCADCAANFIDGARLAILAGLRMDSCGYGELSLNYFRRPQAEREYLERMNGTV